ncbi:hypothetical protein LS70_003775 [Helicobacter sp. MIT 11-5569]|uniref:hypothetical protein n=1 Tax=Helicobacter sp. MIT 11-5569 TaxID=1548151 RepID=UPI0010FF2058|nr:hypothetical protein [Helicobacter sp. MIT 11-5569]TLD83937.1 hypothetical protein LS70_003775 [Helicobacter sp. MIT 11-5569]
MQQRRWRKAPLKGKKENSSSFYLGLDMLEKIALVASLENQSKSAVVECALVLFGGNYDLFKAKQKAFKKKKKILSTQGRVKRLEQRVQKAKNVQERLFT